MTRTAYHRAPDRPLDAPNRRILAKSLEPGDVIQRAGFIPLTVIAVRVHEEHSMVAIDYECFNGTGADRRAYAITELVQIKPRTKQEAH